MFISNPGQKKCSSKEQSHSELNSEEYHVNQCVMYEDKDETSKQEYPALVISKDEDKNCQSTLCYDKNCQCVHMWQVKPAMTKSSHIQLAKPAILQSNYKKGQVRPVCNDKNCQSARSACNDKNCQSTQFKHMWPVKSAMPQTSYKKCNYKKCKVNSEGTQSSSLWSVSKTASKQIGTQPEVTWNCVHTVLPTHNHFVCQQAMCKHSKSKTCYPSESTEVSPVSKNCKIQSNHSDSRSSKILSLQLRSVNPWKMQSNQMWPVKAELQKSQVNTRSQVQTNKYKWDTKTQA